MEGKLLVDGLELGEAPHWDAESNSLYFVDILGKSVHRYRLTDNHHASVKLNDTVGAVVPIDGAKGEFLIGLGRSVAKLHWNPETGKHNVTILATVEEDKPTNRFNDAKADPNGNLWIGTMGEANEDGLLKIKQGALYKFDKNCKITNEVQEVNISNGLAWHSSKTKMYYIDTTPRKILEFDFKGDTSAIGERRVLFDLEKNNVAGMPDGMTIDAEDNLWIACWSGKQLIKVSTKTGELLSKMEMPRERPTSVVFGGPGLKTLYVTFMAKAARDGKPAEPGALYSYEGLGVGTPSIPAGPFTCC